VAFDPGRSLDDVDWRILESLQADGRLSFSELGRRVAMSAPAVAERVRRLEDSGVIRGYRADVDLERLGRPVLAVVRIRLGPGSKDTLGAEVSAVPQVVECLRVTGDDCYVTKVSAGSMAELEVTLDALAQFGSTTTSIVLSAPRRGRVVSRS
jgi:Lrp/AsnC family leucine-responsive transcriptional regulator